MTLTRQMRQCKSVEGDGFLTDLQYLSHLMIKVHFFLGMFHRQWKAFLLALLPFYLPLRTASPFQNKHGEAEASGILGELSNETADWVSLDFSPWYPRLESLRQACACTHARAHTSGLLKAGDSFEVTFHNRSPERVQIDLG